MGLSLTENVQAVMSALDEVSAGLHRNACKDTHHRHMTEVVVVHHFHDLQHTMVGGHSHQPLSWGHDLTHMNTCGALALNYHLGKVICSMNSSTRETPLPLTTTLRR